MFDFDLNLQSDQGSPILNQSVFYLQQSQKMLVFDFEEIAAVATFHHIDCLYSTLWV
jgi:hypothetical protein